MNPFLSVTVPGPACLSCKPVLMDEDEMETEVRSNEKVMHSCCDQNHGNEHGNTIIPPRPQCTTFQTNQINHMVINEVYSDLHLKGVTGEPSFDGGSEQFCEQLKNPNNVLAFHNYNERCFDLAFHPFLPILATASEDGKICIWDIGTYHRYRDLFRQRFPNSVRMKVSDEDLNQKLNSFCDACRSIYMENVDTFAQEERFSQQAMAPLITFPGTNEVLRVTWEDVSFRTEEEILTKKKTPVPCDGGFSMFMHREVTQLSCATATGEVQIWGIAMERVGTCKQ